MDGIAYYLKKALLWLLGSLVLSVVYYELMALVFSTDVEKALKEENDLYEQELPQVEWAADMLEDEVDFLTERDIEIYRKIFNAELPDLYGIMEYKPADATALAARIEDNLRVVMDSLCSRSYRLPPLSLPLHNLSYTNVGASVGERMNPFYKLKSYHGGLDLVAPEGSSVYAAGPGRVLSVRSSSGGKGNVVEISHPGGYVTRYAHLSRTLVRPGMTVRTGTEIGLVGNSGRSFATHLHYEVLRNGEIQDPVNYMFGSLPLYDYLDFFVMGTTSGQSMD